MTPEQVLEVLQKTLIFNNTILHDSNSTSLIWQPLSKQKETLPFQFSVDEGVSKACIFIEGMDEVIKIPFSHYFSDSKYDNYRDDLMAQYNGDVEKVEQTIEEAESADQNFFYTDFECAHNYLIDEEYDLSGSDYCELECAYYQEAVKRNLEAYFAAERFIGWIGNRPIYAQQRATPFYDYYEDEEKLEERTELLSKTYEKCDKLNCNCFDAVWVADFIDYYGEGEFRRLSQFLEDFDIRDLRRTNIGYLNGAPILFDYSGFNEQ